MDFINLMVLICIICVIVLVIFSLVMFCKYESLIDNYKYLNKELDSLSYEVYHRDNAIFKKCDKTLKLSYVTFCLAFCVIPAHLTFK